MNELMNFSNEKKYSSIYLTEQINHFRDLEGDNSLLLHKNLLVKIEKEFSDEIDGLNFKPISYIDSMNREKKAYELTFEYAIQLLMSESKTVRRAVVQVLKKQQKQIDSFSLPQNYSDALRQLADTEEKKQKALLELNSANEVIKEQMQKVVFVDALIDADLLYSLRDCAKQLELKPTVFNKLLIEKGFLFRKPEDIHHDGGSTLRFYSTDRNRQLFRFEPWSRGEKKGLQVKITIRGLEYFRRKIYTWMDESKKLL